MAKEMLVRPSLLDYLSWECGCEFLSDLHYLEKRHICKTIAKIPDGVFPSREWGDAFSYLTGEPKPEITEEKEWKRVLTEKLGQEKKEVEK